MYCFQSHPKNISAIWRRYFCWLRAAKFTSLLSAYIWIQVTTKMNFHRVTAAVKLDLGFCGVSHFERQTRVAYYLFLQGIPLDYPKKRHRI